MNDIAVGATYKIGAPVLDPMCIDSDCDIDRADLIPPWPHVVGTRATVLETGLDYHGHPAVRIAIGKVDWHPNVVVALTDDQVRQLGIISSPGPVAYVIVGQVWAGDPADMTGSGDGLDDTSTFWMGDKVAMPQQRSSVIPASMLIAPKRGRAGR